MSKGALGFMRAAKHILILIAVLLVLIFVYASLFRPEIVNRIFLEKVTSPPAILTGMVFGVGFCGFVWKRVKSVIRLKGE